MQAGACCKHLVAYDLEGNGPLPSRVYFDATVDTRSFWEHYMPVFHDCVKSAKAMHVMCSYNSMNGIPTCADPNLMNGILRDQWDWDGFVVSDYDAWANIFGTHHFTKNMTETAAVAINAGLDQEGGGTKAIDQLQDAIDTGLTAAGIVQKAFRRLMRMRIRLGMFDPPGLVGYNRLGHRDLRTPASTAINRRAAAEGMVLLKNGPQGSGGGGDSDAVTAMASKAATGAATATAAATTTLLLPLAVSELVGKTGSVLVTGPVAANGNNTLGNYACDFGNCSTNVTSILGGIINASSPPLNGGEVVYVPGCSTTSCPESTFPEVTDAAARASVVVVVLGTLGWDRQNDGPLPDPNAYEREGHDRTSIALPANQYRLAAAAAATSNRTPVLCVLIHGGSIKLGSLQTSCTAIVDAWFPGQQGGAGFADVVFGVVSPAGRSPQTYYEDDTELPKLGNIDLYAGNGTTYRYYSGNPTVPFGFGLSYSTFAYSALVLNASSIGHCDSVGISVTVTNTGAVDSDEVVQLYVKTPVRCRDGGVGGGGAWWVVQRLNPSTQ